MSYRCNVCKASFKKFIFFEGHFAFNAICRAKNGWFLQCYQCSQKFRYFAELKYHLQRHVNKKPESKQTHSRILDRVLNGQRGESETSYFNCSKCKRNFRTKFYLNEHMLSHSKHEAGRGIRNNGNTSTIGSVDVNGSSSCSMQNCTIDSSKNTAIEKHDVDRPSGSLKCDMCHRSFTTEISLNFHRKLFHQNDSTNEPQMLNLECEICHARFTFAHNLMRHKLVHVHGDEECQICHIKFTKRSLELHEKKSHPELAEDNVSENALEVMSVTDSVASSSVVSEITSKENEENPEPTHRCEKCDRFFSTASHLRMHIKSHRQYSCHICDSRFKTVSGLKSHRRRHVFECYVCKIDFSSPKHLAKHLTKHIVYEQWVDPINVHLSNWCPEQAREILQNQPLVLVENLNIKNVQLNFADPLPAPTENGLTSVKDESSDCHNLPYDKIKVENEADARVNGVRSIDETKIENCQIELKYSEQSNCDVANLRQNSSNPSDSDDILVVEQQPDITTTYDADVDDIIDLSSESDVDIMELFHCYFCDETFRSLDALGVHVKKCSFCP